MIKQNFHTNHLFLTLISAVLSAFAFIQLYFILSFISLIPLFIVINKSPLKKVFFRGFIFGAVLAIFLFFWMFTAFKNYTDGENTGLAFGFIFVSIVTFALFYGLVFNFIAYLGRIKHKNSRLLLLRPILIASVFTLFEMGFMYFLKEYPLHNYRVGFPLTKNIYSIQLASLGGLEILSFFTVLVNILLANSIITKKKNQFYIALTSIGIVFLLGFGLKISFKPNIINKSFKVSSISTNMDSKNSWNQNKVNQLAENYFRLIDKANKEKPDFILFPESAIPWNFYGNDDLLNEFQKKTNPNTGIVIGLNVTETIDDNKVQNSVFYLKNKKVLAKYKKEILIKGIETPILGKSAPFAGNSQYLIQKNKFGNKLFNTPFGKAGILICNESIIPSHAIKQTKKGANFFFNSSNDSWFKDVYITLHHFYNARLISVITRKDFAISSNCGYNAIIKSSGEILKSSIKSTSSIITGNLQSNTNISLHTKYSYLFSLILFTGILLQFLITYIYKKL